MGREDYWWITATDPESGKPYLIAGGRNEDEARQKAFEMLAGTDFVLKKLPTRSLPRASSLLKGNRLEETKSLHKAAERMGHDRSINRLREHKSRADPSTRW
jgi:hypothetical protein